MIWSWRDDDEEDDDDDDDCGSIASLTSLWLFREDFGTVPKKVVHEYPQTDHECLFKLKICHFCDSLQ